MNPPDLFPAADRNREVGILEKVQTFSPARDGTGASGTCVLWGLESSTPHKVAL